MEKVGGKRRIRVVGIVSNLYSGSTALSAVLGAHRDVFNMGEIASMWNETNPNRVKGRRCSICRVVQRHCSVWDWLEPETIPVDRSTHSKLAKGLGANVVVDSSKNPVWFNRVDPRKGWLLLHLVKSPLELAASYKLRRPALRLQPAQAAYVWYKINSEALKTLFMAKRRGALTLTITYRDFAEKFEETVAMVMTTMGKTFEEGQKTYFEQAQHFVGGNSWTMQDFMEGHKPTQDEPENKERYQTKGRRRIYYDDKHLSVLSKKEARSVYSKSGVETLARHLGVNDRDDDKTRETLF